jgi:hypothetical protein
MRGQNNQANLLYGRRLQRDNRKRAAIAAEPEEVGPPCQAPLVQAGNDDFCTLPKGHDGAHVAIHPR